jgi:hypothetical protein
VVLHHLLVVVGGGRIGEGRRRHVDRQVQGQALLVPAPLPQAGLLEHHVGQALRQALALDQRHELHRPHDVAVAATPARQRLDRHHLAVAELHLRLEPRQHLAVQQRGADVVELDLDRLVVVLLLQPHLIGGEHRAQLVRGQRLLDDAEHAQAVGAAHGLHGVEQRRIERAHQRHAARQPALGDMADELDAVHAGHVQVHQHHVRRLRQALQQFQRAEAVGGFVRGFDPEFGQQPQRHAALEAVVLDHHDL